MRQGDKQMAMTYQQQYVLDGTAGRDAILNLTARQNRCYSDGDRSRQNLRTASEGNTFCSGISV